jgi:hypothetical protein
MFQEVHLLEIGAILKRFIDLIQTKGGIQKYFPWLVWTNCLVSCYFHYSPKLKKESSRQLGK